MYNPYIIIPLATWLIAQFLKISIEAFRGRLDWRLFYASGGMPSAHSAVVASLATTSFLLEGLGSHLFGLTVVVAAIVMYDSLGVRRASGKQAERLNEIIVFMNTGRSTTFAAVREVLGHEPKEVGVGAALGVVLAGLFNYDKLSPLITFLTTIPDRTEVIGYAVFAVLILVVSLALYFGLRRANPRSRTVRVYTKKLLGRGQMAGWVSLAAAAAVYEKAGWLSWRLWSDIIIIVSLITLAWTLIEGLRMLPPALMDEADQHRRNKWLEPSDRRRKRAKRR